jgi:dTDP-4-dehydrorhamnose 3,5-epimerase
MKIEPTVLPDVLVIEPVVHRDARGFLLESYNRGAFAAAGIPHEFVQENHARSARNTLRGLHYQLRQPQGKLVRAIAGAVFDVAVDLRKLSPTFGQWVGTELTAENLRLMWVPPGFAHGLLALTDAAEVLYKVTDFYAPAHERCIAWDDPDIGIRWPLAGAPLLSARDAAGVRLRDAEVFD